MSLLVLRLAAPLQSWSGYRHLVSMNATAPTEFIPTKSAVSGLIGAALGPVDHGFGSARDLDGVSQRYTLHARVEARNATTEDFQVLAPLGPRDAAVADRAHRIGGLTTQSFPNEKRGQGNFPITVARRDYLSHAEFMVGIDTEPDVAGAWLAALRRPVFMPYLGRRSCAPTFPFVLGIFDGAASGLFGDLPHVDKYADKSPLIGYEIDGSYTHHATLEHAKPYVPAVTTRQGQLDWAKENLR